MDSFKYFKLNKVVTEHTTLTLVYSENDEVHLYSENDGKQLFGVKTDNINFLNEQHEECEVVEVNYDDIKNDLINSSQAIAINEIIVNMIKQKYSYNDEIKLLNTAITNPEDSDYQIYRNYVEQCRQYGRTMKIKAGIKQNE